MDKAIRNNQIKLLRSSGKSYAFIGNIFGVSRQRVHQICDDDSLDLRVKHPKSIMFNGSRKFLKVSGEVAYEKRLVHMTIFRFCPLCKKEIKSATINGSKYMQECSKCGWSDTGDVCSADA